MPTKECPLCREPSEIDGIGPYGHKCDRCGNFETTHEFKYEAKSLTSDERLALMGYIRHANLRDELPRLTKQNYRGFIILAPHRIPDKAAAFLEAIEQQSEQFGQSVDIDIDLDYPLAYAKSNDELAAIIGYLRERSFIEYSHTSSSSTVTLRAEGVEELESRKPSNLASEKAFVAMSFGDELKSVYENFIAKGIQLAGYRPIRLDYEEFIGDIVDRILAEIRESRFVVADFTEQKHGVYYEAGFALGLSLPVIHLCRKDHLETAHFDIEHVNHLVWEEGEDFSSRLDSRIRATIGRGPVIS